MFLFQSVNIRKIKRALENFYATEVRIGADALDLPDENLVAEGDVHATVRLLELLLGCAVQCQDKEEHVTLIMTLAEEVKGDLMACIQELMEGFSGEGGSRADDSILSTSSASGSDLTPAQVKQIVAEKDEIAQLYRTLKGQHDAVLQQLDTAQTKLETLQQQVQIGDAAENGDLRSTPTSEEATRLQQQLHSTRAELQEYRHTLEHEREEHALAIKEQTREVADVRRQLERAEQDAAMAERLQDELEELREKDVLLHATEKKLATFRKRIEQYEEMEREAVSIREQNSSQSTRIAMLEEQERRLLSLQQSLAKEKARVAELEEQHLQETKRGDALLFELTQVKEDAQDMQKTTHRLTAEKRELTQRVLELQEEQVFSMPYQLFFGSTLLPSVSCLALQLITSKT